jgi:hypothetical protein
MIPKGKHWSTTHGGHKTRLYGVWCGMKNRCYYPGNVAFKWYGGRGVKVCDEWLHDFGKFRDWAESTGYREGLCLDRKNNDLGYSPENCRWVTTFWSTANRRGMRLKAADAYVVKDLVRRGVTPLVVAALYGITPAYVSSIKNGHAWRDIDSVYAPVS